LHFFQALDGFAEPASSEEIAAAVAELAGGVEPPLQPKNVANKIWRINRQFAVALIASTDDGRYFWTATLREADRSASAPDS